VKELTEMKHLRDDVGKNPAQLRRHGVCGIYSTSDRTNTGPDEVSALQAALATVLSQTSKHGPGYAVTTTGSAHSLANGGIALIVGQPRFQSSALAELALAGGSAAALARGYEDHAEDIFALLAGAFACAIIDPQSRRVLLGIDRMGQQTLYYRAEEEYLHFGSSAGAVLSGDAGAGALQHQGIYNYVYFHMVPSPGTVYRGMQKLPGAHYLDYRDGQVRVVNYWRPAFSESSGGHSFVELSHRLKDLLRNSVESCLTGDRKTGAFLSGGLDSSTVAGVFAELRGRNASAYSIGFSAEGYDEMAFARITAKHFNVALNEYYVTPQDVVDALPLVATSYDEPFGNSSALPAYFCAKMAAEDGVDLLLAGDGGDEIFGGNERYVKQRVFEHYGKVPTVLRRALIEPILSLMPSALPLVSKARSYIAQANTPLPDRLQSYNFLHRHAAAEIFSDAYLAEVDTTQPIGLLRSIYNRPDHASDLNRMLYLDWQVTLADNDLRKVSHMCALAGVDVAYPMLDDDLVEFSCQVPSAWKIRGHDLRHFYKQALTGWLPRETIQKTKQGFGLPFGVWMRTYKPLREMAYDNLARLKDRGFIRPEFIDRAIAMHQSEHAAYYGELVWILTVFELWLEGHPHAAAL